MTHGGHPTDYKADVIDRVHEYLATAVPENMKIPTIEGVALKLEVSRDTVYEWAKVHSEFSDTLELVRTKQKEYLMEIGIFGGKEINATIVALLLRVNHNMVETQKTDITSGGKPVGSILGDVRPNNSNNETPESD